jgi:hypothetical protein
MPINGSDGFSADSFLNIALPAVFALAVLVFIVLGLVLAYHWRKYSYNAAAAWLFQVVYWGGGGLLIFALGGALVGFMT